MRPTYCRSADSSVQHFWDSVHSHTFAYRGSLSTTIRLRPFAIRTIFSSQTFEISILLVLESAFPSSCDHSVCQELKSLQSTIVSKQTRVIRAGAQKGFAADHSSQWREWLFSPAYLGHTWRIVIGHYVLTA